MKRGTMLLAGVASLLPAQLGPVLAHAAPHELSPSFEPPTTPLVLTRTLWRSLRDGQEIVVRRSYEVRFRREAGGFLLDGKLIDTAVDAPAALALLAEIERQRPDQGMFPLRLDQAGRILPAPQRPALGDVHHAAEDRSKAMFASTALDAEGRKQAAVLARSILEASVGAAYWPNDLFSPAMHSRREKRTLALAGGHQGAVEVSVDVLGKLPGGLPQSVERRVTTEVEGSARFSREVWTLVPVSPP